VIRLKSQNQKKRKPIVENDESKKKRGRPKKNDSASEQADQLVKPKSKKRKHIEAGVEEPKKRQGRPKVKFSSERAEQLISLGFTMDQVGSTLGVCAASIKRYRRLNNESKYNNMSNDDLDDLVVGIKEEHRRIGEKRLLGILRGKGIRMQRKRLRESIHRVDPSGPMARCNSGIAVVNARTSDESTPSKTVKLKKAEGQKISVPENCKQSNSLWRIDTITKLEKWKLVITFSIDMFSRLMSFMVVSNESNKHAENLLSAFSTSVDKYSCPEIISSNMRQEKALIWQYMIEKYGEQCVNLCDKLERVRWITIIRNELNMTIFNPIVETFEELEIEGSLDINNPTDVFCLHYVYLPRINKLLHDFLISYNASAIPHGCGVTPVQRFYDHFEKKQIVDKVLLDNLTTPISDPPLQIDLESFSPLPLEQLLELYEHANPLEPSNDYGRELYYRTGTFVAQYLSSVVQTIPVEDVNNGKVEQDETLADETIEDKTIEDETIEDETMEDLLKFAVVDESNMGLNVDTTANDEGNVEFNVDTAANETDKLIHIPITDNENLEQNEVMELKENAAKSLDQSESFDKTQTSAESYSQHLEHDYLLVTGSFNERENISELDSTQTSNNIVPNEENKTDSEETTLVSDVQISYVTSEENKVNDQTDEYVTYILEPQ